jgi:NhaP-type Na+/H+ and K+/H+ antiporters
MAFFRVVVFRELNAYSNPIGNDVLPDRKDQTASQETDDIYASSVRRRIETWRLFMFFLSLFLIVLGGGIVGFLCQKIHLPALIGYLVVGIVLGSFALIDQSIMVISSELRKIALLVILLKAGLSLNLGDLRKVGRPAILLCFLPACLEMCAVGLLGHYILGLSFLESFLLGAVLGAVSPAVVVPRMVKMMENGEGTKKGIPQMIVAGSSCDDIVMIVFYTSFLTIESGDGVSVMSFLNVPISMVSGVGLGLVIGFLFSFLFKKIHMRDSLKLALILGVCFGLVFLESFLGQWFGFSSLLAAITIGITVLARRAEQAKRLATKCDQVWAVAEIFLFVLVGSSIKIDYALTIIWPALLVLTLSLLVRISGVFLSLTKTRLNFKERSFVAISYLPKATVQAAIGGGLLDLGLSLGNPAIIFAGTIVLSVSVVSILLTAPLGAIAIDLSRPRLIKRDDGNQSGDMAS